MPDASCAARCTAARPIASGASTISGGTSMPAPPLAHPSVSTTLVGARQFTAMLWSFISVARPA